MKTFLNIYSPSSTLIIFFLFFHINIFKIKSQAFNLGEASNSPVISLIQASKIGDLAKVQEIINIGVNVNLQSPGGYTALMGAARMGHINIIKELIKAKANIYAQDNSKNTALTEAAKKNNFDIVKLFLSLITIENLSQKEKIILIIKIISKHEYSLYNIVLKILNTLDKEQLKIVLNKEIIPDLIQDYKFFLDPPNNPKLYLVKSIINVAKNYASIETALLLTKSISYLNQSRKLLSLNSNFSDINIVTSK